MIHGPSIFKRKNILELQQERQAIAKREDSRKVALQNKFMLLQYKQKISVEG